MKKKCRLYLHRIIFIVIDTLTSCNVASFLWLWWCWSIVNCRIMLACPSLMMASLQTHWTVNFRWSNFMHDSSRFSKLGLPCSCKSTYVTQYLFMLFWHIGRKTAFSLQSATHWAPCFCGVHSKWWRPKRIVVCRAQLLPTLLLYSWLWWSLAAMTTRANHRSFIFFWTFFAFCIASKDWRFQISFALMANFALLQFQCNESNAALHCDAWLWFFGLRVQRNRHCAYLQTRTSTAFCFHVARIKALDACLRWIVKAHPSRLLKIQKTINPLTLVALLAKIEFGKTVSITCKGLNLPG